MLRVHCIRDVVDQSPPKLWARKERQLPIVYRSPGSVAYENAPIQCIRIAAPASWAVPLTGLCIGVVKPLDDQDEHDHGKILEDPAHGVRGLPPGCDGRVLCSSSSRNSMFQVSFQDNQKPVPFFEHAEVMLKNNQDFCQVA